MIHVELASKSASPFTLSMLTIRWSVAQERSTRYDKIERAPRWVWSSSFDVKIAVLLSPAAVGEFQRLQPDVIVRPVENLSR